MPSLRYATFLFAAVVMGQTNGPHFSISNMDRTADPCVDFYRYACGNWIATNPIPADQASWSQFDELQERNRVILRQILEKASPDDPTRDPVSRQIGDFYYACTDEQTLNRKGLDPIRPELDRIAA